MKRLKVTKTNIEKLQHPEHSEREDRYFATNCSHLCIVVQPKPSLKKSYYAHWSKIIINPDGTQKRTGRYKYICRFNDKTVEAVMAELKVKIKDWKKERDQSSRKNTVATLVKEFIAGASAGYRIKKKGGKIKYKQKTTESYNSVLSAYVLVRTKDSDLRDRLTAPFKYDNEYVTGALKDLPLNKVTKKDVEIWHNRLEATPTVANRALSYLSVVFEWDMRRSTNRLYKSDANPCSRISHYVEKKHKDYLKLPKVLEVRNYCIQEQWRDPHFLTFYCMLLECGERLEDLFKLLWQRPKTIAEEKQCSGWIDFEKNDTADSAGAESDIIFAGRLVKNKNVDLLIKSIALIKEAMPSIKCLIIGDGPERNNLEALVADLHLEQNVSFLGSLDHSQAVFSYLKASRVFVLPSTREGFGIVLLEANACGLPVVTVKHSQNAACDLIIDGKNGFLSEFNKEDMASKIMMALERTQDISQGCVEFSKQYIPPAC